MVGIYLMQQTPLYILLITTVICSAFISFGLPSSSFKKSKALKYFSWGYWSFFAAVLNWEFKLFHVVLTNSLFTGFTFLLLLGFIDRYEVKSRKVLYAIAGMIWTAFAFCQFIFSDVTVYRVISSSCLQQHCKCLSLSPFSNTQTRRIKGML